MKVRAHIRVSGTVQGVFFRAKTMNKAISLGATGWVRNLPDGRVEAVFEGEEDTVKSMVEYCRKGPKGAVVTVFDTKWEPFKGEFRDFRIRHNHRP